MIPKSFGCESHKYAIFRNFIAVLLKNEDFWGCSALSTGKYPQTFRNHSVSFIIRVKHFLVDYEILNTNYLLVHAA